jgi:hypothetical protein
MCLAVSQPEGWEREVAVQQLRFHQERIAEGSDVVSTIMQNIFWAFGVGVLAATQVREAIAIIPVFWSAWMLHALQRSRDTKKHEIYARELEHKLSADLGQQLLWNSKLTSDGLGKKPKVEELNTGYWVILNAASWLATAGYFITEKEMLMGYSLAVGFLVMYGAVGLYLVKNRDFEKACTKLVKEQINLKWNGTKWE